MSRLRGGPELRARLRALKLAFKPIGKTWGEEDVRQNRRRVPVRTGRLQRSFRVRNATQKKTVVVGHFTANFIDAGTKAHTEVPKRARTLAFQSPNGTIFAKKVNHRRTVGNHFKRAGAEEALRLTPMADQIIKAWNDATR